MGVGLHIGKAPLLFCLLPAWPFTKTQIQGDESGAQLIAGGPVLLSIPMHWEI